MGINVRTQNSPKPAEMVMARTSLEKDLKSCMRCKYFYGNNSQCLAKNCIREDIGKDISPKIIERNKEDICHGCPYRQSERYCFPCMRKILRGKADERVRKGYPQVAGGSQQD